MEKIVNTQTNIFNENKSNNKIAKITFMFLAMIFGSWQSEVFAADVKDPNLVVPVVCADGNINQKYEQCAKPCENVSESLVSSQHCSGLGGGDSSQSINCSGKNIYQYTSTNSIGVSFSQQCDSFVGCSGARSGVINKCKASCDVFKNQCSSYVVRIMDLMSAMPEIGISRVDPNLIEF